MLKALIVLLRYREVKRKYFNYRTYNERRTLHGA
nr:MAG TPA: hypothetical protein [Caudoviricetes sp.]